MTETKTRRKRLRIGDLLVQNKRISEQELEEALAEQKKTGHKLGRTLIQLGYLSENEFLDFLAKQLGIPRVDLKHFQFRPETVRKLPEKHARRHRALLLSERDDGMLIAMADPTDLFALDELSRLLNDTLNIALVRETELVQAIDTMYRRTDEISTLAEEVAEDVGGAEVDLAELEQEGSDDDAPVIRLLRSMFEDAVQVGASDVHIEPGEKVVRIRLRVDGQLQEQIIEARRVASALVTRLKLMAQLNISEKRLPQDGRFAIRARDRRLDVRLSTMPIEYGESVVMRLLDQSTDQLNFDSLGIPDHILSRIKAVIQKTSGMLIVTGPTGSGKTTTLYSCLNFINKPECKIITVEDPVEYRLPRVNQVQINNKIGLDFSRVLRTALRQDPDVVMVGEMRDQETSEIGLRAAMTGHLVLSTLHTTNAVDSVVRLMDMGAKGYLVASSVSAVVAQRLIRRNCSTCVEEVVPSVHQRAWLTRVLGESVVQRTRFKQGAGCTYCGNTGYRGRIGVYELLEIDAELAELLTESSGSEFSRVARQRADYQPLLVSALRHLVDGITSIEDVMRLGGGIEAMETFGDSRSPEDDAGPLAAARKTASEKHPIKEGANSAETASSSRKKSGAAQGTDHPSPGTNRARLEHDEAHSAGVDPGQADDRSHREGPKTVRELELAPDYQEPSGDKAPGVDEPVIHRHELGNQEIDENTNSMIDFASSPKSGNEPDEEPDPADKPDASSRFGDEDDTERR